MNPKTEKVTRTLRLEKVFGKLHCGNWIVRKKEKIIVQVSQNTNKVLKGILETGRATCMLLLKWERKELAFSDWSVTRKEKMISQDRWSKVQSTVVQHIKRLESLRIYIYHVVWARTPPTGRVLVISAEFCKGCQWRHAAYVWEETKGPSYQSMHETRGEWKRH